LGVGCNTIALVSRHVLNSLGGSTIVKLIPTKATFAPGETIEIEFVGASTGPKIAVQLWHLDRLIATAPIADGLVCFDAQPVGGYGLVAVDVADLSVPLVTSAMDVLNSPFDRPRYGFVAEFNAGRDSGGLVSAARGLHLNLIQFYDWAHRYAQLVPDTEGYLDPLNRLLSLETVRSMTEALAGVGSRSMGYAAVYAVGGVDWEEWKDAGLFKTDGEPHRFTDDLLLVVDPVNERWMKNFIADLRRSTDEVGFDGFHLDSYGWPKRALRADGTVCDLNEAFPQLLDRIREVLPASRFMFNNVNDFPTWSTTKTDQDATYIEVWAPNTSLVHLGGLIDRARGFGSATPPILAAYLSVYTNSPAAAADDAARFVMATIFSHGGTHLLNGESDTLLVHPYYPQNHVAEASTKQLMRKWYDFLVRYGDLLLAPEAIDVTRSYTGGINEDLFFIAPDGVRISTDAEPGTIWVRVVRTRLGLVVHLINLSDQTEITWDTAKHPVRKNAGVKFRWLKTLGQRPPMVADPDGNSSLQQLTPIDDGSAYLEIELPELGAWTMLVLPEPLHWPSA
jgi:dextranase